MAAEQSEREILAGFVDESIEGLEETQSAFADLASRPDPKAIQSAFRTIHSIKGNASFFGLFAIRKLSHALENLLDGIRSGSVSPSPGIAAVLVRGTGELLGLFSAVRRTGGDSETPAMRGLLEALRSASVPEPPQPRIGTPPTAAPGRCPAWMELAAILRDPSPGKLPPERVALAEAPLRALVAANPDVQETRELQEAFQACAMGVGLDPLLRQALLERMEALPALAKEPPPAAPSAAEQDDRLGHTIRVKEEAVDAFLAFVGELVTVEEMYESIRARLNEGASAEDLAREMQRINETFRTLSRALQESILEIRRLPISPLLRRMSRIAREVGADTGKLVQCLVEAGDAALDKSQIETLEAPLLHIVRNAVDHGIETPAIRSAAGKPETGTVKIRAEILDDEFVLHVEDDGKGLDFPRLEAKAREFGLVAPGRAATGEQLVEALFHPGLSTAEKVTDISGRGVGMDVVRSALRSAGGRIEVTTEPGRGSGFHLHLPRTASTQILSGFVVVAGGERFVLPVEAVQRALDASTLDIQSVAGRGRVVLLDDQILPTRDLPGLLDPDGPANRDGSLMVVVGGDGRKAGMLVDATEGIRQVVLKPLGSMARQTRMVMGGAILGDGSVALVLDPRHLLAEALAPFAATAP